MTIESRSKSERNARKSENSRRWQPQQVVLVLSIDTVLDLSSVKYPAQIVVSRANVPLDIKNNPVHRQMMYRLGGYDLQRYENKGLTLLGEHLKDLSKKSGF